MATSARIGHGTIFRMTNVAASPLALVDLGEITNITPPSETTDVIDATHMQSPGRFREFILGLSDGGDSTFDMNFVPGSASEDIIIAARASQLAVACQIQFPNAVTWDFDALVTGYEPDVPVDDKMTVAVTLKVTGQVDIGMVT